jgi:hypothetical protein
MENQSLNYRKIFVFWYPLAATWLMMALEGPFLAAIITRLPEPTYNLAAFWVAISFALLLEAPIIMLMSASTALVKDKDAFIKLRNYTFFLNALITLIMIILLIPPVFYLVTMDLFSLPRNVARIAHIALILFLPWPAAIGFRRFYQGILIRYNLTRRVAYGTIVRLGTMATISIVLYSLRIKGAYVGASALGIGVTLEAIVTRIMAHRTVKQIIRQPIKKDTIKKPLTYSFITRFYYPLALTSILALGVHPVVNFFLGRSLYSLESLAVLPVINSLVFIFRSIGLSYQEVGIALIGENNEGYIPLRNFAVILGLFLTISSALIAFTPFAKIWFYNISGLSIKLSHFSYLPTQIMVLLPCLTVWISFQRSILVTIKSTRHINWATILEVLIIIGILEVSIRYLNLVGIVAAACAYTFGRLGANLYLIPHQLRALQK